MTTKRRNYYRMAESLPTGFIIEQVREYGQYMRRWNVGACLSVLVRRGAISRLAALQSLDLYGGAK